MGGPEKVVRSYCGFEAAHVCGFRAAARLHHGFTLAYKLAAGAFGVENPANRLKNETQSTIYIYYTSETATRRDMARYFVLAVSALLALSSLSNEAPTVQIGECIFFYGSLGQGKGYENSSANRVWTQLDIIIIYILVSFFVVTAMKLFSLFDLCSP